MHEIISTFLEFSLALGYPGIIFLMTIESSFIPFPSEVVIPPAAYLASQGHMNILLVILSGILGSLIGACINYWLARYFGRKIIYSIIDAKIFKLLLINAKKIQKAEEYFIKHGKSSTFFGRLVVAVRQLISIPAGFSKMKFSSFMFYTALGSSIWVIILGALGYFFGAQEELLSKHYMEISIFFE